MTKRLFETMLCPECGTESLTPDFQCFLCHGTRRYTRLVVCGCCYANHHAADCPYFCRQCQSHHEHGEHAAA